MPAIVTVEGAGLHVGFVRNRCLSSVEGSWGIDYRIDFEET